MVVVRERPVWRWTVYGVSSGDIEARWRKRKQSLSKPTRLHYPSSHRTSVVAVINAGQACHAHDVFGFTRSRAQN